MNWKLFIIVCINSAALLFPYNIIGCADGDDPYDYFVSFFHKDAAGKTGYEPFYYTNYLFLYGSDELVNTAEITSAEWSAWSKKSFTAKEAYDFVCRYPRHEIASLYYNIEKNQPLKISDSVKNNGMTKWFQQQKDLEALGYILYAKQVEPFTIGSWDDWQAINRDSTRMAGLLRNGQQLHAAAKNDFIKLRYAYQVLKLAKYSGRNTDCIRLYDELVVPNKAASVLQDLSLALKAGAQHAIGEDMPAAFTFSQLFAKSKLKRVSNYLSFSFCVDRYDDAARKRALQLCKTNTDKANMMGLFALGSNKPELNTLQQMMQLDAEAAVIPVLLVREIHKLEEFLFTPSLAFAKGEKLTYINYNEIRPNSAEYTKWQQECKKFVAFCRNNAGNKKDKGLYLLSGSHAAMISGDAATARTLLDQSKAASLSPLQKDQWAMTNLLLSINSRKSIDANFEKELLPSLEWLEKKAGGDPEFGKFGRRLFADILAPKYRTTKNTASYKGLLCRAVADNFNEKYVKDSYGYYARARSELQSQTTAAEVQQLIKLMESKQPSGFDKFLISNASFDINDVNDVAGTTLLRHYNFTEAEKWFKKVPASYYREEPYKTYLAANPFADLLLDTHAPTKQDTVLYTKLSFTQKMIRLTNSLATTTDREKKALIHYELAKGYYHMSYWGNSWLLVQYGWQSGELSAEDRFDKSADVNPDYYDVKKAKSHYLDALASTLNKNFQAKCIFMAAKCDQKVGLLGQLPYTSGRSEEAQKKEYMDWLIAFDKRNSFFTQLRKNFNTTPFYKEAYNTCSYLKDFVKGN
jgi:hypothetical protein